MHKRLLARIKASFCIIVCYNDGMLMDTEVLADIKAFDTFFVAYQAMKLVEDSNIRDERCQLRMMYKTSSLRNY